MTDCEYERELAKEERRQKTEEYRRKDFGFRGRSADPNVERAYRRGYFQGAALCLAALRDGVPVEELELWERRLFAWRLKATEWNGIDPVTVEWPPAPTNPNPGE